MLRTTAVVAMLASSASAEPPCRSYDAGAGTTPNRQGWLENLSPPATVEVIDGVLHQSTLPLAEIVCNESSEPQSLTWVADDVDFTFTEGVVFELVARVEVSQFNANPCEDWPRPGFGFGMVDADARRFWVGIGSGEIFLASEAFEPFGHPGIVTVPFDSTDGVHTYRLEIDGPDATLLIDGDDILSLGSYGSADGGAASVWTGDPTSWANSDVEIHSFRVHPLGEEDCVKCEADFNGDGAVNILDFVAFQTAFVGQDPSADCDGNGVFNILDFVCFQAVFAEGCP